MDDIRMVFDNAFQADAVIATGGGREQPSFLETKTSFDESDFENDLITEMEDQD